MSAFLIGNFWLREKFNLPNLQLPHESRIDTTQRERVVGASETGAVLETFPPNYGLGDANDPIRHIEFGLKYDGLHLDLLAQVFRTLPLEKVDSFVAASPSSRAARQIGFLYEFLTGKTLLLTGVNIAGGYIPILDPEKFLTASTRKITRWHVDDNLLGTPAFTPTIRRTKAIDEGIARDWQAEMADIKENTAPDLFYRALAYFYLQETQSSFLIENEKPGPQRTQRFAAALREAGRETEAQSLTVPRLVKLQNTIMGGEDSPYAVKGLRENQNFVGRRFAESKGGLAVDYISPPPAFVPSIIQGLQESSARLQAVHPLAHAAAVAFQFVYIHPFEDGNGRSHRFLLHDILARRQFVKDGLVLPLSMTMLKEPVGYKQTLEAFGVLPRIRYEIGNNGSLTIKNPSEVESAWRYPDLTRQVEYVQGITAKTIAIMPDELAFLGKYDVARSAIQEIADMPDQRLDTLLEYLHEGKGELSKNRRKNWAELLDSDIERIKTAYRNVFDIEEPKPQPILRSQEAADRQGEIDRVRARSKAAIQKSSPSNADPLPDPKKGQSKARGRRR